MSLWLCLSHHPFCMQVPMFSDSDRMDPTVLSAALEKGQADIALLYTVLGQCMDQWASGPTGVPQSLHMPGAANVAALMTASVSNIRETCLFHHCRSLGGGERGSHLFGFMHPCCTLLTLTGFQCKSGLEVTARMPRGSAGGTAVSEGRGRPCASEGRGAGH